MVSSSAELQCPFCRRNLLEGATVCSHCNAFKSKRLVGWKRYIGLAIFAGSCLLMHIVTRIAPNLLAGPNFPLLLMFPFAGFLSIPITGFTLREEVWVRHQ